MSMQGGSLSLLESSVFIPKPVLAATWVTSNSANSGRFGRTPPPPLPSPPSPLLLHPLLFSLREMSNRQMSLPGLPYTSHHGLKQGTSPLCSPCSLLYFSLTPPWEIWQEILIKVWNLQNNKARVFNIHICQFDSKSVCSHRHFFFKSLMLLFYISVSFLSFDVGHQQCTPGRNQTTRSWGGF